MSEERLEKSPPVPLNERFKDYKKTRISFDSAKDYLTDEIRRAEAEIIAGGLKKEIIIAMLNCGDFKTMSSFPDAFYTETTESDVRYSFLAEAAVLAADYFRKQGFSVDVRWDDANNGKMKKKLHRAGIYFDLNPQPVTMPQPASSNQI